MSRRLGLILLVVLAGGCAGPHDSEVATAAGGEGYEALVELFGAFRDHETPDVVDGVPDYSAAAMTRQHAGLAELEARLHAIDDRDWPIAQRVDWMLVQAEMRGLDFHHRVLAPWRRDPAFYSTVYLGFGPRLHGTLSLPELPLADDEAATRLAGQLRAIPQILADARENLTELKGDLAKLAISRKRIERNLFERLAADVEPTHADVAALALGARDAIDGFIGWLEVEGPRAPLHGGIGVRAYDWFARYVLLYPYDWQQMMVLGEREYERAVAFLALEEHRNRAVSMTAPADTLAAFEQRREEADRVLLRFLRDEAVLSVPEYVVPGRNQGPYILPWDRDPTARGPFDAPVERHFFRQTEDREPLPLRAHNVPGHVMDSAMLARDARPIRGGGLLYFIQANRAEGWAYYLEGMIQQLGLLADRPGAREVNGVLQAKRAARIRAELKMHANAWSFDEALESLTTRTPRWMAADDPIAIYDLELYLRQPGLGVNYPLGRMQIEQLLAEVARERGVNFDLRDFHDEFVAVGMIPISLIRWQMTGRDDQIERMRTPRIPIDEL